MSEEKKSSNMSEPDAEKNDPSGSLLQRATSSLRRMTGAIDQASLKNQPQPPEESQATEDLLGDLRAALPRDPEPEPGQPTVVSPEDLRRMTGGLEFPRVVPGLDADNLLSDDQTSQQARQEPEQGNEQPAPRVRQQPDELSGGMTSPFRRVTGPLSTTDSLQPPAKEITPSSQETEPTTRGGGESPLTGGDIKQPSTDLSAKEAEDKEKETPGLIRRITGSLKRVTGSLGTSPQRSAQQREDSAPRADAETGVLEDKAKRDTGPLGSLLSNILRSQESTRQSPPEESNFVSEMRQDLVSGELKQQQEPKQATNILQRLTGGLRRVTGSLGHTAPIYREEPEPAASVSKPAGWSEPDDIVIELSPEPAPLLPPEPQTFPFGRLEEIAPPETTAPHISATGDLIDNTAAKTSIKDEEKSAVEIKPDWLSEIRQETAKQEEAQKAGQDDARRGADSSSLRNFLTGLFRTEEKTPQPADTQLSDELVTDRLGKNLAVKPIETERPPETTPTAPSTALDETHLSFDDDMFLTGFQPGAEQDTGANVSEGQLPFFPFGEEEQEDELKDFVPFQPVQPQDDRDVFIISPEDEKLLWGSQPESLSSEEAPPLPPEWSTEGTKPLQKKQPSISEDTFTTASTTGAEAASAPAESQQRLRQAADKLSRDQGRKPFEDIRSALLSETQANKQLASAQPAGALASGAALSGQPEETRPGLRAWLASRTVLQKIILVEIILVILAGIAVVSLFFIRFYNGKSQGTSASAGLPHALPADVPYPIDVTLPGGWYFQLAKSTFVNNKWTPKHSEWLEGTELRRVIALPWNPQTEAVIQTFRPQDVVRLTLSNQDQVQYKVDRVERVSVDDVSIFTDVRPSLAIILFRENSQERWVVFCNR